MCEGENRGGVGSGREPDGRGGEWQGKGCGENINGGGYNGWGINGVHTDAGGWPHSV